VHAVHMPWPPWTTQVGIVLGQSVSCVQAPTQAPAMHLCDGGQSESWPHWMHMWWSGFEVSQTLPVPAFLQSSFVSHGVHVLLWQNMPGPQSASTAHVTHTPLLQWSDPPQSLSARQATQSCCAPQKGFPVLLQ
jgi:hypothetical protein